MEWSITSPIGNIGNLGQSVWLVGRRKIDMTRGRKKKKKVIRLRYETLLSTTPHHHHQHHQYHWFFSNFIFYYETVSAHAYYTGRAKRIRRDRDRDVKSNSNMLTNPRKPRRVLRHRRRGLVRSLLQEDRGFLHYLRRRPAGRSRLYVIIYIYIYNLYRRGLILRENWFGVWVWYYIVYRRTRVRYHITSNPAESRI